MTNQDKDNLPFSFSSFSQGWDILRKFRKRKPCGKFIKILIYPFYLLVLTIALSLMARYAWSKESNPLRSTNYKEMDSYEKIGYRLYITGTVMIWVWRLVILLFIVWFFYQIGKTPNFLKDI